MAEITPKAKLLAVYNADRVANGLQPILEADFDFGVPEVYNGTRSPCNTRLYLTPKAASLSIGRITLYYDRINLSTITNINIVKGSHTRVQDVLPQINIELGITLVLADINDTVLPTVGPFNFQASATNLLYTGTAQVGYET